MFFPSDVQSNSSPTDGLFLRRKRDHLVATTERVKEYLNRVRPSGQAQMRHCLLLSEHPVDNDLGLTGPDLLEQQQQQLLHAIVLIIRGTAKEAGECYCRYHSAVWLSLAAASNRWSGHISSPGQEQKATKKGSLLLSIISNINSNSNSLSHRFPLRLYTSSVPDSASSPLQQHSLLLLYLSLSLLLSFHHQEQKQQHKPRNKK
jgi:hypothetical protein